MQKHSIKNNFIYQIIYEVVIIILPLVSAPYVARVIGPEGTGIYSYHYSVASYFLPFSNLGIKNYGNRIIAKSRDDQDCLNKTFSNLVFFHILISIVVLLFYVVYIYFFVNSIERIYSLIMIFTVVSGLIDISWYYFGTENFKITVTTNVFVKIISFVSIFLFVKTANDLWKYCLILAFSTFLSQIILWFPLKDQITLVKPSYAEMYPHFLPMLILFIPSIAVSFYKTMDKIMIGVICDKIQLGYYDNAEKIVNIPNSVINAFGTVMLPRMSNIIDKKDRRETLYYTQISMLYVMWLSYALCFGLASIAQNFAPFFFGKDFTYTGYLIMGLCTTIPFMSFANVLRTQFLIPSERDKEFIISLIGGALINLIMNLLLLPHLGAMGAILGTITSEIVVCMIQCWYVRNDLPLKSYFSQSKIFILFGSIMFFISFGIGRIKPNHIVTLVCQIFFGLIVYVILSGIYFYIKHEPTFLIIFNKLKRKITR